MSSIFLSTNCAGSVYSFQLNSHQKVILKHERQGKGSSFYLENLGQRPFHIKINDVIMPDGLKALLNDSNNSLFSRLYPRIVKLSDGTLKLYLNFRLLGGMISDEQNFRLLGETIPDEHNEQPKPRVNIIDLLQKTPEVKNSSIKDFVRYNLPLNTFSVVSVKSVNYSFGGLRAVNARRIHLAPGANAVYSFLINVRRFFAGYQYANKMTVNGDVLSQYILGEDLTEEAIKEVEEHVRLAWEDQRAISVYVSQDGNDFEARLEDAKNGACIIS